MIGFTTIAAGAKNIHEAADQAHEDRKTGSIEDTLADANLILADCETLMKQARDLRDQLRQKAVAQLNALKK